jgi:hypothetical protein
MSIPEAALPPIDIRPLCVIRIAVDTLLTAGGPAGAGRRIGTVPGGSVVGERLSGRILPGGSDWQTQRGDGATLLDARLVLRTDDDALIAIAYGGIRHGPPEVMARLGRGEMVDPREYYFRITPSFSTSDPRYEWLNRIIAVGTGSRAPEGPLYEVYEVA